MSVIALIRLRRSLPGKHAGVSVDAPWRLASVGCLCYLLAASTLAFVAYPTDAAQKAWEAQEEAVLPSACITTVIEPAYAETAGKFFFVWLGLFGLPALFGGYALDAAFEGRGPTRR